MQKKTVRKITLSRETLTQLDNLALDQVKGGYPITSPTDESRCFVC